MYILKQGEQILGTLQELEKGFPWVYCLFSPTEAFSKVKPLFDWDFRLLELDEFSEEVDEQIRALDLRLYDEDGEELGDFQGHIHGNDAWFRG